MVVINSLSGGQSCHSNNRCWQFNHQRHRSGGDGRQQSESLTPMVLVANKPPILVIYLKNFTCHTHSCQYRTIRNTYHIVCKKFRIVSAYHKCSWIILYRKIIHIVWYIKKCFKMRFFVKICAFIWI